MVLTPATGWSVPLLLIAGVGCGSTGDAGDDAAPYVLVTMSIWADVVGELVCDGAVEVRTMIPAGGDPHAYEPSLRDRETLDGAALVVANGLGLEESLDDTLDQVADAGTPIFAIGDQVEALTADGSADPHLWFDPTLVATALAPLGAALVEAGADAQVVERCTDSFERELTALDRDVAEMMAAIPDARRTLVTNHDSLRYFAERYDLEVLGTVLPSATTLTEANPASLEALADRIDAAGAPAIFSEELASADDARRLAERLDVRIVSLYTDALGETGSPADHYLGLIRTDALLIADALGSTT